MAEKTPARRDPTALEMPSVEDVACACRQAALPVPSTIFAPLTDYLTLLARWNKTMNLVGARHWREALLRLVADSFYLAAFLNRLPLPPAPRCLDLGAGAGLPGIPLRMLWQQGDYYMVEAREKRAAFLTSALAALKLPRTRALHARAENCRPPHAPAADLILSRAFLPWPDFLELARPALKPRGFALVLALTPVPSLPPDWHCCDAVPYVVDGTQRFFWALQPAPCGNASPSAPARRC